MARVVLAYSGGLDTSAAIKWLGEKYGLEVVTLTLDIGQPADFDEVRRRAELAGAAAVEVLDAREEFVRDFIFPALRADAVYQDHYPLATALSRPLIAKYLVEAAHRYGAEYVAHGCTGKGNDQVRFEVSIMALDPELKVIAPAREWGMSREGTVEYLRRHRLPVPVKESPYSIDENLWGRSIECGILEDPEVEPPEEVFSWTRPIEETPDRPRYVEIAFKQGVPVALDEREMDGLSLIGELNRIAGEHGVGRIDHVEDRLVGIKSREVYEAPAATVLLKAHRALEALNLSRDQLRFKSRVAQEYAELIYNGLWYSAFHEDLKAYVESTQRYITGRVRVKLFKGECRVVGRSSEYSLYNYSLATYEKGDVFDQKASSGFIYVWGLPVRTQARAQPPGR